MGRRDVDGGVSLARLAPSGFSIRQAGRVWSLEDIEHEASRLRPLVRSAAGENELVEIPARDPVTVLSFLEASWREKRVPTPRARIDAPARVSVPMRWDPPLEAALVIRTSGSTGEPKHVAFSAESVIRSATKIARYLELARNDRIGIVQSLEHGYGLVGQLFSAIAAGSEIVWASAPFVGEQVKMLEGVTVLSAVAYTLGELVRGGLRADLRCIGSAGGPLGAAVAARVREAFPNATLWNQYGCTEAGPRLTACSSKEEAFAHGSAGRALEGAELRVDDEGQVLFRADTQMIGYAGRAPVGPDEWIPTGDIGRLEDGHLFITGRNDEVVKIRGHKVPLALVARTAERCGARAAIAVALPSKKSEELEVIVVYEGDSDVSRIHVAKELPLECAPARLVRVDALPRLPSGKLDRKAAATLAGERT